MLYNNSGSGTSTRTCHQPVCGGIGCLGINVRLCNTHACDPVDPIPIDGNHPHYTNSLLLITHISLGYMRLIYAMHFIYMINGINNATGGWSSWGPCSASCGGGISTRNCTNPPPSNDGLVCPGIDTQACNTGIVPLFMPHTIKQSCDDHDHDDDDDDDPCRLLSYRW